MQFSTYAKWDKSLWQKAESLYLQAFPHGSKSVSIIRSMLEKEIAFLHLGTLNGEVIAMAITGITDDRKALQIDYLTIRENRRSQGFGEQFINHIRKWAESEQKLKGIIIEVESNLTPINLQRIRFWQKCGFTLTDYIHSYQWVPEPYKAMYLNFDGDHELPADGESLFRYITQFHKKAYRG